MPYYRIWRNSTIFRRLLKIEAALRQVERKGRRAARHRECLSALGLLLPPFCNILDGAASIFRRIELVHLSPKLGPLRYALGGDQSTRGRFGTFRLGLAETTVQLSLGIREEPGKLVPPPGIETKLRRGCDHAPDRK